MTHHDHKNKDTEKDPYEKGLYRPDEERPRNTVRVFGMQIEPAQFSIICFCLLPLALLYRFDVFESAGLNSFQTLAIAAPVVVMALLLAFTHHYGHYLHMALTEKLRQRTLVSRDRQRRVGEPTDRREDERD